MTERSSPHEVSRLLADALVGLDESAISRLADESEFIEVAPGTRLASEGEPADAGYVVAEGSVQLGIHQRQADLTVATLGKGELLGWSWMVEPHMWSFDVSSVGGARLLRVPADVLLAVVEEDPVAGVTLCRALLGVLSRRLRDTRVQLLDVHASAPDSDVGRRHAPDTARVRDSRRGPLA